MPKIGEAGIGLGRRVGDVVGADDEGDVGLAELGVDVLELEHLVIGHVGLGQQHVHVARHAAGDRMDGVFDLDALRLQLVGHLAQGVLGLGHRHAVAGHDDDLRGVLHDEGGVVGRALLDRPRLDRAAAPAAVSPPKPPRITEMKERFIALAHDVGEDRAGRADQRAGDDQGEVAEGEADARRRPAGIGVQHRDDDRHVGAADRDDDQAAEQRAPRARSARTGHGSRCRRRR